MNLSSFRFPHIPRLFSATLLFLGLWGGFGLLLAINGFYVFPSHGAPWYLPILEKPLSSEAHTRIAQSLWSKGMDKEAKREVSLASDISGSAVLGDSSESEKLEEEFAHWQHVTQTRPDYRDGFIMASSLAYQLGNYSEAKILISKALILDPTSSVSMDIQKLLEER
jgi:hypothetical protein